MSPRIGRLGVAATLGQAVWATRRQWQQLPPGSQQRLQALLRQSGGRPSRLSASDRRELRQLIAQLELGQVVRGTAAQLARRRSRRPRY